MRQRQRSGFGDAALSVTKNKQNKIIKAARYFLQQHPEYSEYDCRFDVIAYDTHASTNANNKNKRNDTNQAPLTNTQAEWLQGAFIASAW